MKLKEFEIFMINYYLLFHRLVSKINSTLLVNVVRCLRPLIIELEPFRIFSNFHFVNKIARRERILIVNSMCY